MNEVEARFEGKKHVIWDWNGTLLNDIDLCVEIISGILSDHGLPTIDRGSYRRKFKFPIIAYYRELGFDFNRVPFEIIAEEFVTRYKARVLECSLFEGARELLASAKENGRTQSILSAAHERELSELTRHHKIDHHFDFICGLSDNFAASKVDRGHALISQLHAPKESILLVGDTDHDLEVAEALGVDALLLGDGHQEYERLKPLHPHVLEFRVR